MSLIIFEIPIIEQINNVARFLCTLMMAHDLLERQNSFLELLNATQTVVCIDTNIPILNI